MGNLACVSQPAEVLGCTKDADGEDWFQFDAPGNCTTVAVDVRMTFPLASVEPVLPRSSSASTSNASGGPCTTDDPDDGDEQRCLDHVLTPGGHYAVRIARTGDGACDGQCAYNRYTLSLQLKTP